MIDDRAAIRVAIQRGHAVTGTLGALVEADQFGLWDMNDAVLLLQ